LRSVTLPILPHARARVRHTRRVTSQHEQGIRLHRVTEEDWESHRDLRLDMLRDSPDAFWSTLADVEGRGEADWRAATRGAHSLQARLGAEVLGGLGILAEPYAPGMELPEDSVNLVAMYVAPRARGMGVGDLLISGAKDLTRELGRRRIFLEVASHNPFAQALYLRHGFRFTGATTPHPRRPDVVEREMVWVEPSGR
jgi:ribosomal protein S18 acetylase RimI-like enzyme